MAVQRGYVPPEKLQKAVKLIEKGVSPVKALAVAGYSAATASLGGSNNGNGKNFKETIRKAQNSYQASWIKLALSMGLDPKVQIKALKKIVGHGTDRNVLGAIRETNRIVFHSEPKDARFSFTASRKENNAIGVFVVPPKMRAQEWEKKAIALAPDRNVVEAQILHRQKEIGRRLKRKRIQEASHGKTKAA